jgi:DNA-binding NarL/FixJ family response regulator
MVIVGGDGHDRHALTARECDILRLLPVEGTNRAIGERLGLEPASVQSVICDLMSKRDRRRAGLISYAYALGLVTQTAVEVMERDD